jgi:threonine dehydratase
LAKAGRLAHLAIDLHDRPGELQKLLALVSETGANVRAIQHDRSSREIPIGSARVMLEVETRNAEHVAEVRRRIAERGYALAADGR